MEVAAKLTRDMAVPCFKGPTDFGKSKEMWKRIGRVQSAVAMTQDPDEREFYDQPCRVVFGCMCARKFSFTTIVSVFGEKYSNVQILPYPFLSHKGTKKSGDMMIEMMN